MPITRKITRSLYGYDLYIACGSDGPYGVAAITRNLDTGYESGINIPSMHTRDTALARELARAISEPALA